MLTFSLIIRPRQYRALYFCLFFLKGQLTWPQLNERPPLWLLRSVVTFHFAFPRKHPVIPHSWNAIAFSKSTFKGSHPRAKWIQASSQT
jgi:hypothetical protein